MKVIKLFPLTIARNLTSGGATNPPFMALYARYHKHAASKAAQEVWEAEKNAPGFAISGALGLAAVWALFHFSDVIDRTPSVWLTYVIGMALGFAAYLFIPGRKQRINAGGEAVEIAVKVLLYGLSEEVELASGARSMVRHYGHKTEEAALAELKRQLPSAYGWVNDNWPLINKAEALRLAK